MDIHNNIKYVVAVQPYDPAATGTKTGIVIDRQGFDSVEFVHAVGAIAATAFTQTPVIFEGAATGTLTSVADGDLIGTEAGARLSGGTTDNKTGKIGYRGTKRYVRMDLIIAGAATGFPAGICALGGAGKGPQSTQAPI
jgi:hypothetical protein